MELSRQVVNLDLSKKLKELGVKSTSLFYWVEHADKTKWSLLPKGACDGFDCDAPDQWIESGDAISAFTVAELGEMLPPPTYSTKGESENRPAKWICRYWYPSSPLNENKASIGCVKEAKTEADARAKMLIHLIENHLLNHDNKKNT